MKKTLVIMKKEFIDTIRDRRSLMMMVIMPILMVFLVVNLIIKMNTSQTRKAEEKVLKVALVTNGNAEALREKFIKREDMTVREDLPAAKIEEHLNKEEIDFGIVLEDNFDNTVKERKSGSISLYFKHSSETRISKRRVRQLLEEYNKELMNRRLAALNLVQSFIEPVKIEETDLASVKEKLGQSVGGFLPYVFILFCFLGAMFPAIDLAAGEKERGTLETLLTSPVGRMQIVTGKFLVIAVSGIISASLSILGLYLGLKQSGDIPAAVMEGLLRILEFKSIALFMSLFIPLCVFFAAVLLSVSIFAKSFKEAQSIMTPLNLAVIFPVMVGLFPGVKLNAVTALIPVLNVSLACKEIIAGTIATGLLLEVYLSLFVLAAAGLIFCSRWFKREDVIFRGI